jgi:tetratricopeptide (TPR) repeat protein
MNMPSFFRMVLIICVFLAFNPGLGAKEYLREFTYTMAAYENKASIPDLALEIVKSRTLDETGSYYEQIYHSLDTDDGEEYSQTTLTVRAITALITDCEVLSGEWEGDSYRLKAKLQIDDTEFKTKVSALSSDPQLLRDLRESRLQLETALQNLAGLESESSALEEGLQQQLSQRYAENIDLLIGLRYFQLARQKQAEDNDLDAIILYRKALEHIPRHAPSFNNLAISYNLTNNFAEAVEAGQKAVELDPGIAIQYANLGTYLSDYDHKDEAYAQMRKAIGLDPADPRLQRHLGHFLSIEERTPEALPYLERAYQLEPNDALTLFDLGLAYYNSDRDAEGMELFRSAVSLRFRQELDYRDPFVIYMKAFQLMGYMIDYDDPLAVAALLKSTRPLFYRY